MSQFSNPLNPQALSQIMGSLKTPSYKSILPGAFGNSPITRSFAGLMQQANDANAQRGRGILGLLSGQGQAQLAQNQQNFNQQTAATDQDLMDRGLYNSTIASNLKQGAQNQLAQNNEAVNEHSALNLANFANGFNQQAPDLGLLAQLLQHGGGGGGGGGFNGGGGGVSMFSSPFGMIQPGASF